jgi:hypothetical protein
MSKMCNKIKYYLALPLATAVLALLPGCLATPEMGASKGHAVTGAAGGETAAGESAKLEQCNESLGTLSVFEDTGADWWKYYTTNYPKLGSTIPVIRVMVQQSNCFVIVERGQSMDAMDKERALMKSGELRKGSDYKKGQMVAADYTLSPSIQFSADNTSGGSASPNNLLSSLGGKAGAVGAVLGTVAGSLKSSEAATTLLLIDNRSGVQIAAAVGNAKNWDFSVGGASLLGGASGFSNTPEGKVIVASFADSYNNVVKALKNYKAQNVKGGLGKGGQLKVN